MLDLLGNWITGVTASAIIASVAASLAPEGSMRKLVRLTGAMLILIALIRPLLSLDVGDIAFYTQQYRAEYEDYESKLINTNSALLKEIIEGRTSAYILEKAEEMGTPLEDVKVTAKAAETEDAYPYPYAAELTAEGISAAERERISYMLEAELGIPADRQTWN